MGEKYRDLRAAVDRVVAVDAHAHNLVAIDSSVPFLRCFSEADGDALAYTPHTLSFKRSLRDIAQLYNCEPTLDAVEAYRKSSGLASICSKCFEAANISTILIDDGIQLDKMHDLQWHEGFVPTVGRVLRIEHLAETILNEVRLTEETVNASQWTLESFTEIFLTKLRSAADKIVAVKSIAAYRSGLQINTKVSTREAEEGLLEDFNAGRPIRIKNKSFIDFLFSRSLEIAVHFDLPMQIHTGFGDNDLDLREANPLHLRTLLEDWRFSKCRIVLLHASYPFSKEASYLASVYPQVYLDFGLAVPKLSVQGMISSVKELLELAPIKKVMFSSDGYAFPETYYLGAKRAREVVFSVLSNTCEDGDLSVPEALEAVDDIFRRNSMQFYKLNDAVGNTDHQSYKLNRAFGCTDHRSYKINGAFGCTDHTCSVFPDDTSRKAISHDNIVLVRIIWVDASGQHRCRVVPTSRFYEVVKNTGVGLTMASMGMSSSCDGPADGTNLTAVGEIRLIPDLSTKRKIPWSIHEEMVLADMQIKPGEAWEYCPRDALRRVARILKDEFNLVMNAGFENEFYLLKNVVREGKDEWIPFDMTSYCATSAFDAASPILRELDSALESLDISYEQVHAESGKGQFEIALKHSICTVAADKVIYTREAIKAAARKHKLLATFVPKYSLDDIGSGCHVHLSLWEEGKNVFMGSEASKTCYGMSDIGEQFMAGVLYHLPSILAFTAPLPNSYDRIQPNTWSGAYQCWGKENREAALRTACPPGVAAELVSNFEIKSFDGCANPHLGLASIMASGIDGLRRKLSLPKPIETNPSSHDSELRRLPKELRESIEALGGDTILKDLIGDKLVTAVIAVRQAEINYYEANRDAYKQLIHRY